MRMLLSVLALCAIFSVTVCAARYTYWRLVRKGRSWEEPELSRLVSDTFYFGMGVVVTLTLL